MIKGVIFDVDGTLLDSMKIWEEAAARYLRTRGREPERNLSERMLMMTVKEGAEYIRRHYAPEEDTEEITRGVLAIVEEFYCFEVLLKEGAEELLRELWKRRIPITAATSGERSCVEAAFERLGVRKYFKAIFTCSEVGAGKTMPFVYQRAAEYLGIEPEEACVFEDALYALETAKKAGFRTVGIYDEAGKGEQAMLERQADIYLSELVKPQSFWDFVSDMEGDGENENSINNSGK